MRSRVLDLVACPSCGANLRVSEEALAEGDELLEGSLACAGCAKTFAVRAGVPRLLPETVHPEATETSGRFADSWATFDRIDEHYEKQFLGWIAPNEPEDFAGRVVLEGGCGKGRHSTLVAQWGAKDVIATDLGSAVEVAFRNTRHLPNVHVVQADLLSLPVPPTSVDVAFSVGVLHHVTEPESAFRELVRRVKPGGKVMAWVYGRENNGWIVHGINPIRSAVTSRVPFPVVNAMSVGPAALLWLASRGVYRPLSRGPMRRLGDRLFYRDYIEHLADFPFWELHCIVADHLAPGIAYYLRREEFEGWFERARLQSVQIGWHNQNSWRGTGVVPVGAADHDGR